MFKTIDPNSIITGGESAQGMTYLNSTRVFRSESARALVATGRVSPDELVKLAPRVFLADFKLADAAQVA